MSQCYGGIVPQNQSLNEKKRVSRAVPFSIDLSFQMICDQ
jgi:hypothetical protein